MKISEHLLNAAREVEEACGMIENEKILIGLRGVVNLLCFTSAVYLAEHEEPEGVKDNVVPFKRK